MPDYLCVMIVGSLVIGFILGRWRVPPDYCGDVIVSADSETCTFALDIPADDIPQRTTGDTSVQSSRRLRYNSASGKIQIQMKLQIIGGITQWQSILTVRVYGI